MDFEIVVKERRSIRSFDKRDVPLSTIKKIMDIGHMAPSAGNLQARDFIIVKDEDTKDALGACAYGQSFISDAPWIIVVCGNQERTGSKYGKRGRELYSIQDATASVENMLLAVTNEGLGSVWIGAFDEECVSDLLNIPAGVRPLALLPVGYPINQPSPPERMDTEEITHEGRW